MQTLQRHTRHQRGNAPIILAIALLLIAGGGAYYLSTRDKENTPVTSDIAGWEKYTNAKYGFELQHPANSTIETRTDSGVNPYHYIRIQNFTEQDTSNYGNLATGQFYLEIFIYDHQLGAKSTESCPANLANPQKVDLGTSVIAYKGAGLGGGDIASHIYAACATKPNVDYYIQASEDSDIVAKKIIDSLKFIN